jgi:hypothetical protein
MKAKPVKHGAGFLIHVWGVGANGHDGMVFIERSTESRKLWMLLRLFRFKSRVNCIANRLAGGRTAHTKERCSANADGENGANSRYQ